MDLQRRAAKSSVAPLLSWGLRAKHVGETELGNLKSGTRWLFTSKEHTNFTYDLTPRSFAYMAAFVSVVSEKPIKVCQGYLEEVLNDDGLVQHVKTETLRSTRRRISDPDARIGRRAGWYALARAVKPNLIVETGTDKGLGSVVLASALLRNGNGRLVTIDVNDDSGFLIQGKYGDVIDRQIGTSLELLGRLSNVDVFIHDSNHEPRYEFREYLAVEKSLSESAIILTDNSSQSTSLFDWSVNRDRQYLDFREEPTIQILRPEGIGASWCPRKI